MQNLLNGLSEAKIKAFAKVYNEIADSTGVVTKPALFWALNITSPSFSDHVRLANLTTQAWKFGLLRYPMRGAA
ncbi:hypothetical protein [Ahrensia sp. R2A130]|uniref:hypothetical protein n=1 Tax=Ahrensia sp. R2A130 TaxID=744979 RepID=UPI0001E0BCB7|nr:hypothetical protein [Ahrensia sp. R2A130]EFL88319.1 putative amino acid ABC transporter, periplasmic amino acid-binding protein [Ahrensia sp. R2A130]